MAGDSRDGAQRSPASSSASSSRFTSDQPRLRASDVCRRSGMPFSTVHRLLAGLAGRGVLHRSHRRRLRGRHPVVAAGGGHPQLRSCARRAAGHVRACTRRPAPPSTCGARRRRGALRRGDARPDGRRVPLRHAVPLRAAAGGQVLLAYAELRSLTGPRPVDERLPSDERLQQIMRIRRDGVAVSAAAGRLRWPPRSRRRRVGRRRAGNGRVPARRPGRPGACGAAAAADTAAGLAALSIQWER